VSWISKEKGLGDAFFGASFPEFFAGGEITQQPAQGQ
jgi:hypothetical protein